MKLGGSSGLLAFAQMVERLSPGLPPRSYSTRSYSISLQL